MSMVIPSQAYSLILKPQPAPMSVFQFSARLDISELYEYHVEFTSPIADIPMEQVVGRPATFTVEPVDPDMGYLQRMFGERWKDFSKMPAKHSTHGVVQRFENLGSSADETRYRVTLVPKIADLARARKSRLFQKQSVVEIITDTLRHYGYRLGVDFDFKGLRGKYKRHDYITQYHETTFAFVQRLCAEEGLWFRFEQKHDRTVIIFGDDLDAYARKQRVVPYRSHSGLESAGAESIRSLRTITRRVPEAIQLNDYNHRQADVALLVEQNAAPGDKTTDGVDNHWGEHYETLEEGREIARRRHEEHLATQISYRVRGNPFSLEAGEVVGLDVNPKDAPHGLFVTSIRCGGGRSRSYWSAFRAIPADRRWRTSIDSVERPKIEGILPARIDSPGRYQYSYLTEKGLYVAKMPFDLDEWSPGGRSRPIRMARPYAGGNYGHHFPLIDGVEVALIFTAQDPNRPVIIGALHDSLNPDLVNNLNNTRNIIRSAALNELRMEDKEGIEHIHLTTPFQTSELNLGHMVDGNRKERGRGAELRSDERVAVRGGKGVFVTAQAQPSARGMQLDMTEGLSRLDSSLRLAKALASTAEAAGANVADTDSQQKVNAELKQLAAPGVFVSAPASIGLASESSVQVSARDNIAAVAGGSLDISALKRLSVAVGESISLFAQKLGIKLFAGRGPVDIQAQSDAMSLLAAKDLTVSSVNGSVRVQGKREVVLESGGAFIRIADGNVTIGGPGDLLLKIITMQKQGPATLGEAAAVLPTQADVYDEQFTLRDEHSGEVLSYHPYRIETAAGELLEGVTDAEGRTVRVYSGKAQELNIFKG